MVNRCYFDIYTFVKLSPFLEDFNSFWNFTQADTTFVILLTLVYIKPLSNGIGVSREPRDVLKEAPRD
jgi:hypothetical protein